MKGDLLFAYTDGLVEIGATDGACEEIDIVSIVSSLPEGPDFNRRAIEAALGSSRSKSFSDDVTIVAARML